MLPKLIVKTNQTFTPAAKANFDARQQSVSDRVLDILNPVTEPKLGVRHHNSPKHPNDTGRASYGSLRSQLVPGANINNWIVTSTPVNTTVEIQCAKCSHPKKANYHMLFAGTAAHCKVCNSKPRNQEHPLWSTYVGMKQRVMDPKARSYKYHGGTGLKIASEWLTKGIGFIKFCEDMGAKPSPSHTLDRINNNLLERGYSKENCRWADRITQSHNRSNNIWVVYQGIRLLAVDWDRIKGFRQGTVARRLAAGFTIDGAIDTATREYTKKESIH